MFIVREFPSPTPSPVGAKCNNRSTAQLAAVLHFTDIYRAPTELLDFFLRGLL